MKTFLALAVLSLATSVTSLAAISTPDSIIHRPKVSQVPTGESGIIRLPRPKLNDSESIRKPRFTAVEAPSMRKPPLPKFQDSESIRKPRFAAVDAPALRKPPLPKFQDSESIRKPRFTAVDATSMRKPPLPKFQDSESIRKPRFSPAASLAA